MGDKRGLSAINVILIILLTIIIASIIFLIINNFVKSNKVEIGASNPYLEIKSVKIQGENVTVVVLKKDSEEGEFIGLNFIFSNSTDSETIRKNVSLNESEQRSFTFVLKKINVSTLKGVLVVPIYNTSSGKESSGDNPVIFSITNATNNSGKTSSGGGGGGSSSTTSSGSNADTTAPVISNSQPSGSLSAGTTSTTISVTTNEAATCRYSTASGTTYASMANTFSTTGATTHSTIITALQNGQTYNYYIKCNDTSGNVNLIDYVLSFGVDASFQTPDILNDASFETNWSGFNNWGAGTPDSDHAGELTRSTDQHYGTGSYSVKRILATPLNIASSTNTTPIEITTTAAHGFVGGASVSVTNHLINTNANANWFVLAVISETKFTIAKYGGTPLSVGNGVGGATGVVSYETTGHFTYYINPKVDRLWTRYYFYLDATFDGTLKFHLHDESWGGHLGGVYFVPAGFGFADTSDINDFVPIFYYPSTSTEITVASLVGTWHSLEVDYWRNGDTSNGDNDYPSVAFWLDGVQITNGTAGSTYSWIDGRLNFGQRTRSLQIGNVNMLGVKNAGHINGANLYFDRISISTLGRIGP